MKIKGDPKALAAYREHKAKARAKVATAVKAEDQRKAAANKAEPK